MSQRQLTKSSSNRMFTGTIAGVGEYFGLSCDIITLMRILYVFFALGSFGTLALVYIVASWLIPSPH
ncbi:PspC domain-containing protein [Lactococcus garvieae]|uniref:PspC domain-containing protein n=1 Tax=Lactococcus garvieae TaxID=1363 RepID=UPI001A8E2564|nr:PspC domain-containing protein [Lactococcus garvieae]QSQ99980.1 PspC domain-containing protein [Lactococcus garvieae]